MRRRTTEIVRGVAALSLLLLLVAGPPLALARLVGWPLPTEVPSLDEVSGALGGGVEDMVVVKALAVVAWLIWAQLAVATLAEVGGLARGRAPRRAPVLGGVQLAVGRLVTTAGLLVGSWGPHRSAPVPIARLAAAVAHPLPAAEAATMPPIASPPVAPVATKEVAEPGPRATYVVKRNDSWWGISEKLLGDGQRWKELRILNAGRTMGDGSTIGVSTETVAPGWELVVPDSSRGAQDTDTPVAEEMVVQRGDNLWAMSERHLEGVDREEASEAEIAEHWVDVIDANRGRLANPANPSLIYPGQVMQMPGVVPHSDANGSSPAAQPADPPARPENERTPATPQPTTGTSPSTSTSTSTTSTTSTSTSSSTTSTSTTSTVPAAVPGPGANGQDRTIDGALGSPGRRPANEIAGARTALLGTAGAMVAVGISTLLARRRRRRQLLLPRRAEPPAPPPELDDIRTELVDQADVDHADLLHCALGDIAGALADKKSRARPRLVQVKGRRVEVLLSEPVLAPPPPWKEEANGAAWTLKNGRTDRDLDATTPTPTLVAAGKPDDGAVVYLDLEAEGVVVLEGEAEVAAGIARSWVLELATSPLSETAAVAVVGRELAPPDAASERVTVAEGWDGIAEEALAWVEQSATVVKGSRLPTAMAARARSRQIDNLAPLVVVLAHRPDDERFERLCAAVLAHPTTVSVVLLGADVEGATRVNVTDDALEIPALGLSCAPQRVSAPAVEKVEQVLEDASRIPEQLSFVPEPEMMSEVKVYYDTAEPEILVRLLGEIAVLGTAEELKRKQLALFVYVAIHGPVTAERIENALWVEDGVSRHKRLGNTISDCRRAVGIGHLPMAKDSRYRVGPGVVTDIQLFERRIAQAAYEDDESAAETLRGALELVDGPVFTYRNADRGSYVWVDLENWVATWELKVTTVAEELAERYLALGDPKGAAWAAQQGLKASPVHTRLTKLLMEAYFASGDAKAAECVFLSYQSATESLKLDDPEIDAEVIDFYHDTRGRSGTAAS